MAYSLWINITQVTGNEVVTDTHTEKLGSGDEDAQPTTWKLRALFLHLI